MKNSWLWSLMLILVCHACASEEKQLLLSTELLSMQEATLPANGLVPADFIQIKRCANDRRAKNQDQAEEERRKKWGALEYLLDKAHAETKAHYFLKATVYQEGDCLTLRAYTAQQ